MIDRNDSVPASKYFAADGHRLAPGLIRRSA